LHRQGKEKYCGVLSERTGNRNNNIVGGIFEKRGNRKRNIVELYLIGMAIEKVILWVTN